MEAQLWGEVNNGGNAEWDKVVPKEIGKLVILSAIKPELPKDKQPQPSEGADQVVVIGPEHSTMEENILYTIQLIQHAKKVSELIRLANSTDEETSVEVKECPPMPKAPERKMKNVNECEESLPIGYFPKEDSPFTLGIPISVPFLGREVTKEILYKSVATLCAHAGFDSAMQSSLQVFADIADSFLKKFTCLLRYAVDREELYGNSGFPDAMERVFHEMGFGSMVVLHDFYQRHVLMYRDKYEVQCLTLRQQYQALLPTTKKEPEEVIRIKTEVECEEDIPEVHLLAEGSEGVDAWCFQMLRSLEQEVQMQSGMEQDEGDNTSMNDSPQGEISHQHGSEEWLMKNKKRKRKLPL